MLALGLPQAGLPAGQLQRLLARLGACGRKDALATLQRVQGQRSSGRGISTRDVFLWTGQDVYLDVQCEGEALALLPVASCPGWELVLYDPATACMP